MYSNSTLPWPQLQASSLLSMEDIARRGHLKVYLGFAPGVGKTYACLQEARELRDAGKDVVVGLIEDHGRARTRAAVGDLEVLPRIQIPHRGAVFEDMDLAALLERRPDVAVVDELAHSIPEGDNPEGARPGPGAHHTKRWQDIETLLEAGIDVLSTVNIQHLESLNDVVESITGQRQRETTPDSVLRAADDVELVDLPPEALRARLARGEVYSADKVDAALGFYFRVGNLTALRELALLWLADQVDARMIAYRREHNIEASWPARERIAVAITGGPESETLIRRGARIVGRRAGRELHAVHVLRDDGLASGSAALLDRQRALVHELGGSWHAVRGADPARALLATARSINASQLVIGQSRRSPIERFFGAGVGARIVRFAGDIDVHIVTHDAVGRGRARAARDPSALGRRRRILGWILALVGSALLTAGFLAIGRETFPQSINLLSYITLSVAVALVGGMLPAISTSLLGALLVNWFFTPPTGTLTISEPESIFALVVYVGVAAAVAWVVDGSARSARAANEANRQASILAELSSSFLTADEDVPSLLVRLRDALNLGAVELVRRPEHKEDHEVVLGNAGEPVGADAPRRLSLAGDLELRSTASELAPADEQLLEAYGGRLARVVEHRELQRVQMETRELSAGNDMRTALLAAVSHDLRTPLTAIKAGISSLRMDDIELDPDDRAELLATIEAGADRLDDLVANLLDMSRISTGMVPVHRFPFAAVEPCLQVLASLPSDAQVRLTGETEAVCLADPGLVERILANVLENAVRYAPDAPIRLEVGTRPGHVVFHVIDRGPGVAEHEQEHIFTPFRRLGDATTTEGLGLGLAVSKGFAEAMDGNLTAEATPGGGLTVVLDLPDNTDPYDRDQARGMGDRRRAEQERHAS